MNEILPGIYHWRVLHPDVHIDVDSYYVSALEPGFLLDPLQPPEGVDWFKKRGGSMNAVQFRDPDRLRWNLPDLLPEDCEFPAG